MSTPIQLALSVGAPPRLSLAEAVAVSAVAAETGVAAIRLTDTGALDPTVVAAYLAGINGRIGYVAEVPTTNHAPYNAARRILSLDRATGGRAGVALLAGDGDEVSEAVVPDPAATGIARRWTEYAWVLTRLWESFPRDALIGDQAAGIVVEDALIRPIEHEGAFYRVAGPLDGPSSVQGRPLVVADLGVLDAAAVARSADVVVVDPADAARSDAALTRELGRAGRSRHEVALLGRVTAVLDGGLGRGGGLVPGDGLDGFELVAGGDAGDVIASLRSLPRAASSRTLRAAFGLREPVAVPA